MGFLRNPFSRRRPSDVPEVSVAVLRGLLEAHRASASPKERWAQMMEIGNRDLRPDGWSTPADPPPTSPPPAKTPAGEGASVLDGMGVADLPMEQLLQLLRGAGDGDEQHPERPANGDGANSAH